MLLEKALRLAQRHVRQSNKTSLRCFFLGSVLVDSGEKSPPLDRLFTVLSAIVLCVCLCVDEEGVTVTLDRFDPGRDQPGSSERVPCAMLPGDVLVPCLYLTHSDTSDAVVQSESELHHCFKVSYTCCCVSVSVLILFSTVEAPGCRGNVTSSTAKLCVCQSLQQLLSSRQNLDLCQLVRVRGRIVCSQQSDATMFSLSWTSVCPSVGLDIQAVRPVPIIPTALLRNLTSTTRPLLYPTNCQKG